MDYVFIHHCFCSVAYGQMEVIAAGRVYADLFHVYVSIRTAILDLFAVSGTY